jgi:hypothetical protein
MPQGCVACVHHHGDPLHFWQQVMHFQQPTCTVNGGAVRLVCHRSDMLGL